MERVHTLFWISVLGCCLGITSAQVNYGYEDESKNLVKNWDFEADFNPDESDWIVSKANYDFSNDAHTGLRSVRIYNRTNSRFTGLFQNIKALKADTPYYLSTFFKVKNPTDKTKLFYAIKLYVMYISTSGATKEKKLIEVGRLPFVRQSNEWRHIGGDFTLTEDVTYLKFEVEVTDMAVQYLVDTVSLIEIPNDPNWKATANAEIEKHRKTVVNIVMRTPKQLPYCRVTMKIHQEKNHFGFGETLRTDPFNEQNEFGNKYRAHITDNFEWTGLMNALKWKPMEPHEGYPRFERVETALSVLEAKNITTRGHSHFWSSKDNNPAWMNELTGKQLKKKINYRLNYITNRFKGRLNQWDVVNENLHNRFYSEGVGNPYMVDYIHNRVHSIDPNVSLYLNDYQILKDGVFTSAIADQARDLLSRGVPVHGIGIQSHLRTTPVRPEIIKRRLEIATNTPLPVTLTEVSIHNTDVNIRAEQLEMLTRIAFSNPKIEAILFWGPSDVPSIAFEPMETALFEGEDFVPNIAGQTLLDLMSEWRSPDTTTVSTKQAMKSTHNLFQGAYTASLYYKDIFVKNESFYVHPGSSMKYTVPAWFSLAKTIPLADGDWDCMP